MMEQTVIEESSKVYFQYGIAGATAFILLLALLWGCRYVLVRLIGKDDGMLTKFFAEQRHLIAAIGAQAKTQTEILESINGRLSDTQEIAKKTKTGLLHVSDALPHTAPNKTSRDEVKEIASRARDALT
jgi:hypothetical protein